MSERKRKAHRELNGQPSKKKSPSAASSSTVQVRYLSSPDTAKPVIGIVSYYIIVNYSTYLTM
jgi:hypothetical protein